MLTTGDTASSYDTFRDYSASFYHYRQFLYLPVFVLKHPADGDCRMTNWKLQILSAVSYYSELRYYFWQGNRPDIVVFDIGRQNCRGTIRTSMLNKYLDCLYQFLIACVNQRIQLIKHVFQELPWKVTEVLFNLFYQRFAWWLVCNVPKTAGDLFYRFSMVCLLVLTFPAWFTIKEWGSKLTMWNLFPFHFGGWYLARSLRFTFRLKRSVFRTEEWGLLSCGMEVKSNQLVRRPIDYGPVDTILTSP